MGNEDGKHDKMSAEEFLTAIDEAGLGIPLQRYIQSTVDKTVEQILSKKAESLSLLGAREKLVTEALETAGLSPGFSKYIEGNTKTEIQESVSKVKADFLVSRQDEIDKDIKETTIPLAASGETSDDVVKAYVEKKNVETNKKPGLGFPQEQTTKTEGDK